MWTENRTKWGAEWHNTVKVDADWHTSQPPTQNKGKL